MVTASHTFLCNWYVTRVTTFLPYGKHWDSLPELTHINAWLGIHHDSKKPHTKYILVGGIVLGNIVLSIIQVQGGTENDMIP